MLRGVGPQLCVWDVTENSLSGVDANLLVPYGAAALGPSDTVFFAATNTSAPAALWGVTAAPP